MSNERIAILDAGSQYLKLIDKTIRSLRVQADILPINIKANQLFHYKGIINSGSPHSVYNKDSPKCDKDIFKLRIPILGICYGMQLISYYYGATVNKSKIREDGQHVITIDNKSKLFLGMKNKQQVLLSHGDSILGMPNLFKITGYSDNCIVAFEHKTEKIYGLQFHPEVDLTKNGRIMISNFLFRSCLLRGIYNSKKTRPK
jgi:GMP synthase (glutamine-hydrolysing)